MAGGDEAMPGAGALMKLVRISAIRSSRVFTNTPIKALQKHRVENTGTSVATDSR